MRPDPMIIANLVAERAGLQPDLDVLTFEHDGEFQTRSYRQLWENAQRIARALLERGLRGGERFALLLPNHPEFVEAMVAAAIAGVVFVPIDPRARGARLAYQLRDSACRGAICATDALPGLNEALREDAPLEWVYVIDSTIPPELSVPKVEGYCLGEVLARAPQPDLPVAVQQASEPMQVMYTSGTTGDPKGIVVPHLRFGAVSQHGETVFGYRADDRPYTGLSLTHGNAQFVTLAPSLKMGLRAVISRRFSKSRLWRIVRAHRCTTFSLLGGMATALYSEPPRPDDSDNPVRLVISAGMPAALWHDFEKRYGVDILEFYGAVDGGMCIKPVGQGPLGSCGRPTPGLIAKVADEQGEEVPRGARGELWFRREEGPFPPVSYLNNPQAGAAKTAGGWLHSGDIVTMDAEGWIFFEYRAGGGIRRNGEFVSPALIEKTLAEYPGVDDAFVYGVPAESGAPGEAEIVAAVVARAAAGFTPVALFEWLATRLEKSSLPTFVQQVAAIPKTASEKPQERFLLERFRSTPQEVTRRPLASPEIPR